MQVREILSTHLPDAVIAAVIFTIFNIYTDEVVGPFSIILDFLLHVVAIFLGFIVINAIWNSVFGSEAT
ncbi:hypothetical protein SAMN05192561_12713 [Halopenitus malekzadehii]|uniref:Uncharacterized protein n=1 Tax=Halopenitus malekzadehii TaxID=1267564 RepID=A0A1H6K404_9EURY|nr:hypothetical protein [Halopenitus malekzadehii]SEH67086.1 hypothetical protein SAMN05192561_12713 [Halopenitus malekzadehii]